MEKRATTLALALTACLTASCRVATHQYITEPAIYRVFNPHFNPNKPEGVTGDTLCHLYRAKDGKIYAETWVAVGTADFSRPPIYFIEGGPSFDKIKGPCQFRWVRISITQDEPRFYSIDDLCDKPEGPLTRIDTVKLQDLHVSGWRKKPSIKWREPLAKVENIVVDVPLTIVATTIGAPIIALYYGVRYIITGSGPERPF